MRILWRLTGLVNTEPQLFSNYEKKGFIAEDDMQQFLLGTYRSSTIRTLINEEKVSQKSPPQLPQAPRKEWDDRQSNDLKEQMSTSRE